MKVVVTKVYADNRPWKSEVVEIDDDLPKYGRAQNEAIVEAMSFHNIGMFIVMDPTKETGGWFSGYTYIYTNGLPTMKAEKRFKKTETHYIGPRLMEALLHTIELQGNLNAKAKIERIGHMLRRKTKAHRGFTLTIDGESKVWLNMVELHHLRDWIDEQLKGAEVAR